MVENFTNTAPLKKTVTTFWRMVWQERPQSIAMIANLWERGKSRCEQYWPDEKGQQQKFGPFTVTLLSEQTHPDIVVRRLKIWVSPGGYMSRRARVYV